MSLPLITPPSTSLDSKPLPSKVLDFLFKVLGSAQPDVRMWYPIIPSQISSTTSKGPGNEPITTSSNKNSLTSPDTTDKNGIGNDSGLKVDYMTPIQMILNLCFSSPPSTPHSSFQTALTVAPYNTVSFSEWVNLLYKLDYSARQCRKVLKQFLVLFNNIPLTSSQVFENQKSLLSLLDLNNTTTSPFRAIVKGDYCSFRTTINLRSNTNQSNVNESNTNHSNSNESIKDYSSPIDLPLGPISRPIFHVNPRNIGTSNNNTNNTSTQILDYFSPTTRNAYQEPELNTAEYINDLIHTVIDIIREYESYIFGLVFDTVPDFPFYSPKGDSDETVVKKTLSTTRKITYLPSVMGFFEFINRNIVDSATEGSNKSVDSSIAHTNTTLSESFIVCGDNGNNPSHNPIPCSQSSTLKESPPSTKNTKGNDIGQEIKYITPLMEAVCALDVVGTEALILCGALFSHELVSDPRNFTIYQQNSIHYAGSDGIDGKSDVHRNNIVISTPSNNNNGQKVDTPNTTYLFHPLSEFFQPFLGFTMDLDDDGNAPAYDIDPVEFLKNTTALYLILLKFGASSKVLTEYDQSLLHPLFLSIMNSNTITKPDEVGNGRMPLQSGKHMVPMSLLSLFINTTLFYLDAWNLSLASPDLFPLDLLELILQLEPDSVNNCLVCDLHSSHDPGQCSTSTGQHPSTLLNQRCGVFDSDVSNPHHYTILEILLSHPYLDITILLEVIITIFSSLTPYTNTHTHPLLYLTQTKGLSPQLDDIERIIESIPPMTLNDYFNSQQKECLKVMKEKEEARKDYQFGIGQLTAENEDQNGVVDNTRTGQIVSLYSSFQVLRAMHLLEKEREREGDSVETIQATQSTPDPVGDVQNTSTDPDDVNNDVIELDTSRVPNKADKDSAQKDVEKNVTDTSDVEKNITQFDLSSLHPLDFPGSNPITNTNNETLDPLDRLAISIDKANKMELEDGANVPKQAKTLFNEHLRGFDFSSFRRYISLYDVITTYEQHNINIGNVEEDAENGDGEIKSSVELNELSRYLDPNNSSDKQIKPTTGDEKPSLQNDQDFMTNILKSLFSSQNGKDTAHKKVSKRDLEREVAALQQIRTEHEILTKERLVKQQQKEDNASQGPQSGPNGDHQLEEESLLNDVEERNDLNRKLDETHSYHTKNGPLATEQGSSNHPTFQSISETSLVEMIENNSPV